MSYLKPDHESLYLIVGKTVCYRLAEVLSCGTRHGSPVGAGREWPALFARGDIVTSARTVLAIGAVALGALPLVACGSDRAVVTAPSTVQATAAPGGAFTVTPEQILPRDGVSTTTPITVTSLVSGTSCPTVRFMVSAYVFRVDAATQYEGGACANIQPGAKINFSGTAEGGTPRVFYVAQLSFVTSSTPPTPTPSPTPTPVQTEGTVTATGAGMCPELQFFFGSYAFNVSYATQYSGGACGDIKAGARVAIVGTKKESESFVRVTSLTFKRDTAPTPEPPTPTTPVSADVTVSSLVSGTSCPNLSFIVGPYKISVSSATTFEYGACVNIAAGTKLGLTGTRQGDGTIAASKIEFKDTNPTNPSGRPVEGEGVISSLSGTTACPTLQFYIGSYLIKLDGSTQYVGGLCTDLKAGVKVGVKGSVASDGSVSASVITVKNDGPQPAPAVEGEGFVTALVDGTSCPSLQFKISEYTITLTASTQFSGGSCTDVAAGRKLAVRGTMTGDKAATASVITFRN